MTERDTVSGRAKRAQSDPPLPAPRVGGESIDSSRLTDDPDREKTESAVSSPDPRASEQAALNFSKLATEAGVEPEADEPAFVASSDPLSDSLAGDRPPVFGSGDLGGGNRRVGDRVFKGLTSGASGLIILIVVLIAAFLLIKSVPSIVDDKSNFFTSTEFNTDPADLHFGIARLLYVTVIISVIALLIAIPIAIAIGLFITQYAPKRLAKPVAFVIDLLAAIPSIIYGIWAATELSGALEPVQRVLSHIPIPLFDSGIATGTIFDGAIVLAVMVLPIVTAISRDVFERTPRANIEAALALGATKWEMIRMSVLPYGRAGVISGSMLGLGRALGETLAVYLVLSQVGGAFSFSIFTGGETFASKIANNASEFNNPASTGAFIAGGLVLFVLTFVVNSAARAIVSRRKDFS